MQPASTGSCLVRRKSDGRVLVCVRRLGDEICILEKIPYWTSTGTAWREQPYWHSADCYTDEVGVLVVTSDERL